MTESVSAERQKQKLAQEAKFLPRTPSEELGPMYPVGKPDARGNDLVHSAHTGKDVDGQIIYLHGQVKDLTGAPVAGAEVELWHADPHGRYPHPCDLNPAPLDPSFSGWAKITTDNDGRYRLRSTKPGPYPTSTPGWWRPPHVHFQVTTPHDRLITQMYFPDEETNDQDELLARHRRLKQDGRVMARKVAPEPGMEPGALNLEFDIVLPTPQSVARQIEARKAEKK